MFAFDPTSNLQKVLKILTSLMKSASFIDYGFGLQCVCESLQPTVTGCLNLTHTSLYKSNMRLEKNIRFFPSDALI
jgi:hypothetical protein